VDAIQKFMEAAGSACSVVSDGRINDGVNLVDVNLTGSGDDVPNAWQAAGLTWTTAKTLSRMRFYNGATINNARGIRVVGQVHTSSQFSWTANVNEFESFGCN
jgi:hypothetical protein